MYDTIIVGKGPAGISAAIYLKRAGMNVLVIGKDMGSLEKAELVENYYGIQSVKGSDLFETGIAQAKNLGIEILTDEITGIEYYNGIHLKTLSSKYAAKTLLFAVGKKKKIVNINGVKDFTGKGVSFCAVCDGFFYKNKNVAVIGSGNYALSEAEYLKKFAGNIKIFTNGEPKTFDNSDIEVIEDKISEIYGGERVEGIKTLNGDYKVDGVFIALGSAGVEDFAAKIGLETKNGNIAVDESYQTNIPGIFAAGDCIGGFLQVSKAVSDGANAANSIIKHLKTVKA